MPKGVKLLLRRGKHAFPFQVGVWDVCVCDARQIWIPKELPTSFSFGESHVKYSMKVIGDVANRDDLAFSAAFLVVNVSDTPLYFKTNPQEPTPVSAAASPLGAGGEIKITAMSLRPYIAPGQDLELDVRIDNRSNKTIKRLEVEIIRDESAGGITKEKTVVVSMSKKIFPKVRPRSSGSHLVVFELQGTSTANFPHTVHRGKLNISYRVIVRADVPGAKDVQVALPIKVVHPGPAPTAKVEKPFSVWVVFWCDLTEAGAFVSSQVVSRMDEQARSVVGSIWGSWPWSASGKRDAFECDWVRL